jgi:peptide/nickel transport system substrate-binding protein
VLTEFRGHAPADRDRLVKALGDKVEVQESAVGVQPGGQLQHREEAVRRRARAPGALARHRPLEGRRGAARIALVRDVGGLLRPGYDMATPNEELVKLPGFGKDIAAARAEARKLLQEAGVPNLRFKLTNRNVNMPYTPVGVFLIDQWRQIGLTVEHEQLETRLYTAALRGGNYDAGLDFNCDFMDEPNLQLIKYISADKSSINYGRYNDRKLDELYAKQSAATDPAEA